MRHVVNGHRRIPIAVRAHPSVARGEPSRSQQCAPSPSTDAHMPGALAHVALATRTPATSHRGVLTLRARAHAHARRTRRSAERVHEIID